MYRIESYQRLVSLHQCQCHVNINIVNRLINGNIGIMKIRLSYLLSLFISQKIQNNITSK